MLPTVARTAEEVLRLVPDELRTGALALGSTRARTVFRVVLPAARTGIVTAIILGIARIIGETAPLLLAAGNSDQTILPNRVAGGLPADVHLQQCRPPVPGCRDPGLGSSTRPHDLRRHFVHPRPRAQSRAPGPIEKEHAMSTAEFESVDVLEAEMTTPVPSMVTELEARNVSVWFGPRKVLEGVNMSFPKNSVTALIGPSGCGKSTFIRTLNRLHELIPGAALAGEILYEGKDIYSRDVDPVHIRLAIGMVFQKPNPFPSMTIRGNVLSGLKLSGMKRSNHDDIVEETLTAAGLWTEVKDRLDRAGGELSGGQQQRLVIARALAVQPHVLLMDEPCSALDPASTLKIEETIRQLSKEVTIVIVTHNMQQAVRVADNTAFFLAAENEPGRVIEQGTTTEIFGNPKDERTLDYVNGRFG
jgi:phosphate transport system ATP-binding protein